MLEAGREAVHRDTAESTNSRVLWWTLVEVRLYADMIHMNSSRTLVSHQSGTIDTSEIFDARRMQICLLAASPGVPENLLMLVIVLGAVLLLVLLLPLLCREAAAPAVVSKRVS